MPSLVSLGWRSSVSALGSLELEGSVSVLDSLCSKVSMASMVRVGLVFLRVVGILDLVTRDDARYVFGTYLRCPSPLFRRAWAYIAE